jgi:hypothetical protein
VLGTIRACAFALGLRSADPPHPFGAVQPGTPALELLECGAALRDQSLAPGFEALETFCLECRLLAAGRKSRANRLGINVTHELANVLTLPGAPTPAGDAPRFANGIDQALGKIERHQLGVAQTYEGLTQVLRCVSCAFALALAGPVLEIIVLLFARRHGLSRVL